jgi:predicted O-methyltransferase YrrM
MTATQKPNLDTPGPSINATMTSMNSSVTSPQVTELLDMLYADAAMNDPLIHQAVRKAGVAYETEADFYKAMRNAYMPVSREFGKLLYSLARSSKAKNIVEFGTSFGISTIFLASAVRDNGEGKVITTEFDPEKAGRAKKNLATVELEESVDFRIGDALNTLKSDLPPEIDLILLDGAKGLYLDVLKLLEPYLRRGGIVASDNTDHNGMDAFLAYLRNADNGYTSSAITTGDGHRGHEISIRN